MPTIESSSYKAPACESHVGNANIDVMEHVISGNEAVGTVIKLRRKNEYSGYVRMKLVCSAAMAVGMTVDLGYISRDDHANDAPDIFGAALDVNGTLIHDGITGAPVEVEDNHEIVLTLNTDFSADAGKIIKVVSEFYSVTG